ncbi:NapC/NirT family cytochrome c [Vreelandella zhuhanensis]|uniref:NapC/NirT family cytochrome c n=1 Tax=Vreelandella zhuhanensis TaxID=2684210 RepID=UPI0029E8265F|nr:NapC/NirT family cytochrome c [Halomonas zhuhanensis]
MQRCPPTIHFTNRSEANDSLECRNCHDEGAMDFTHHKSIAHELPDMAGVEDWE